MEDVPVPALKDSEELVQVGNIMRGQIPVIGFWISFT